MASRFRVDHDDDGNAEVSAAKPRKLRPLDGEEIEQPGATGQPSSPAKVAVKKSALKGGTRSTLEPEPPAAPPPAVRNPKSALKSKATADMENQPPPPPPPPPQEDKPAAPEPRKSAMKSAMKHTNSEPAPKVSPGPAPTAPPDNKVKSAMRARTLDKIDSTAPSAPGPEPPAPPAEGPRKSAMKKRSVAAQPEPEKPEETRAPESAAATKSASVEEAPPQPGGRQSRARPSVFKMTTEIEDPGQWSAKALCKHYFHFAGQKMLWEQHVTTSQQHVHRKSIKLSDVALFSTPASPASPSGTGEAEKRKSLISSPTIIIEDEPSAPPVSSLSEYEISPLKDLLLAKKPDVKKLKKTFQEMSSADLTKWLNATLDATPPPMPAPLFHAVAAAQWDVVGVLVEFKVDVLAQYTGKSLLKGWIKPNTPLVDCVKGRKGRFVGTMLGDKLEAMEALLTRAAAAQRAGTGVDAKPDSTALPMARQRTKSVQLKCSRGLMLHTQGHPNMKFELDDTFCGFSSTSTRAAIDMETGNSYAIRAGNKLAEIGGKDPEAELWNQIVILRKLEHPNIVKLHETFEDESHIFMVFELCKGGELFDHLVRIGSLAEKTTMRLAYQMGSAIRHLHELRICHRDIRPEAFVVSHDTPLEDSFLKLTDFNTAKEINAPLTTKICTLHYVAPEILTSADGYNEKVDIWSFGVVIYVMAAGVPPFDAENELDVLKAVKSGTFSFEPESVWAEISQESKDLISLLMTRDVDKRPDICQAMEHPRLAQAETEGALISPEPGTGSSASSSSGSASKLRNAFTALVEDLDDDQIVELRKLFRAIDFLQSGMVNISDCRERLAEMFHDNKHFQDLVSVLESDTLSGKINYAMFLATMTDKRRHIRREAARVVFNTFDIDKNGNVSLYEIAQAMGKETELRQAKHGSVPVKEIQAIWDEMRAVFADRELSDKELCFEDFFKQLPRANLDICV